jgi:MFS family permease
MEPVHGRLRSRAELFATGNRAHGRAVGEAGGIAPSYSLISDYFPREKRSRALAFYSLGIPIGSALGVFFGGWLAANLVLAQRLRHRRPARTAGGLADQAANPEPERGRFDASLRALRAAAVRLRALFGNASFWLLSFGARRAQSSVTA